MCCPGRTKSRRRGLRAGPEVIVLPDQIIRRQPLGTSPLVRVGDLELGVGVGRVGPGVGVVFQDRRGTGDEQRTIQRAHVNHVGASGTAEFDGGIATVQGPVQVHRQDGVLVVGSFRTRVTAGEVSLVPRRRRCRDPAERVFGVVLPRESIKKNVRSIRWSRRSFPGGSR